MGIDGLNLLFDDTARAHIFNYPQGGLMQDDEPNPTGAKPVDDPDLPEEGDQDEFEPEPIPREDFANSDEARENLEDPADLSDIEKEFDD